MLYSCAYFHNDNETLEQAQRNKLRLLAAKLDLKPGQRVLDIGCGWGDLALYLASMENVSVVGVTLSKEQQKLASQRAKDMGLDDRVEFRLQDYRELDEQFDRIVSVGMFEHVGVSHYDDLEFLRVHYAKTLAHWERRFQENRAEVEDMYDENFARMWEFYLISAEAMFRTGSQLVFHMQLSRKRDATPLQRDYMIDTQRDYEKLEAEKKLVL
jgi:cyclopropane-fatty-acyl-phospholipid synthase